MMFAVHEGRRIDFDMSPEGQLMVHIQDVGTIDALALAESPECVPRVRELIYEAKERYDNGEWE